MPNLSNAGNLLVQKLAQRHQLSQDAVTHMLAALHHGNGTMAQFNHPEFGGAGQWMHGGMTMVSDLFNYQLKSRVDNLCNDIANELAAHQVVPFSGSFQSQRQSGDAEQYQSAGGIGSNNSLFVADASSNWWPTEFGQPSAIGSQNNVRYAYFAAARRLAVMTGSDVWVYDTADHHIGGFSQQQGQSGSITFSSQFGTVNLSTLRVVSRGGVLHEQPTAPQPTASYQPTTAHEPIAPHQPTPSSSMHSPSAVDQPSDSPSPLPLKAPSPPAPRANDSQAGQDVLETLERLGGLKDKGYITDEEFALKKAELLSRL